MNKFIYESVIRNWRELDTKIIHTNTVDNYRIYYLNQSENLDNAMLLCFINFMVKSETSKKRITF